MQLRNCILVALAFDATPEEIEHAHNIIDRVYGADGTAGGVDPQYMINANVSATHNGVTATGQQTNSNTGPAAVAASHLDLDAAGLSWDERIHSSNRKKNDKGLWWAKRGVTPQLKAKVEQEIRNTLASAGSASPPDAATLPPQATPAAATTGLPPMPGAGLPPLPGAASVDPQYTELVQLIASNTQSATNPTGRVTDDWVKQVLVHYGVADGNLQNLAHAPAVVPQVLTYIKQALGA